MKKVLLFIFTSLLLLLTGCSTKVDDNTIAVGMECAYQPFNWTIQEDNGFSLPIFNSNDHVDGYDVQIAKIIGEKTGKKVVIKKTVWESLVPDLNAGNLDIILAGMTATPDRRAQIDFTDPYLESELAFLIKTENLNKDFPGNSKDNPATYDELLRAFDGKGLVCQRGVVGDGFIEDYFTQNNKGYTINHNKALDTYPLAANDVSKGNAYAMPAELPVVEAMTNLGGLSVLHVDKSFLSADDQVGLTVSIGVKKGNKELLNTINGVLDTISKEERAELMGKAAERSSGDADALKVGMECAYQPFNWTLDKATAYTLPIHGSNQHADGYDVQVAKYLGKKLNRKVVIKKTVWDSLVPDLNNGNIDIVLAGMTATPERREQINFTDPYLRSELAFLIKTENKEKDFPGNSKENPATIDELLRAFDGKGLVCQMNVVGDGFIDTYFTNNDKGYKINHNNALETYPLAANDVKSGNAYAMPAELPVVEAMTNLGGLSVLYVDKSFLSADDQVGLTVSIGVKKGNDKLLAELNAALASLSDEARAEMMGAAAARSADSTSGGEEAKEQNKYFTIISKYSNWIIAGILTTLILAIFGTCVGLVIGIFIAYGKNIIVKETDKTIIKVLKRTCLVICQIYSTVLRGTPMMVQALIFKYGCQAIGINFEMIKFSPAVSDVLNGWLLAGLIVITLNTSAYMAEIVKSGLNGVDQGQVEGAKSLGMSNARTSFSIILPQALRNCLPTIGNELIVNIKDSSVLNVIAVSELFYRIKDIASTSYAFFECYIIVACIYLVLTLCGTGVLKLIERKMDGVKFDLNPFRRKEEF